MGEANGLFITTQLRLAGKLNSLESIWILFKGQLKTVDWSWPGKEPLKNCREILNILMGVMLQ